MGLEARRRPCFLPTIIISGLVTGRYFLGAWWTICVAILVWVSMVSSPLDVQAILFWSAGYAATAYFIWLFSSHLERLLEAASRSGEERREAVVEERMRLAREVHDTLAQGFTGDRGPDKRRGTNHVGQERRDLEPSRKGTNPRAPKPG